MVTIGYSEYSRRNLLDVHTNKIMGYINNRSRYDMNNLNQIVRRYFGCLEVYTVEDLIKANPQKLEELKKLYDILIVSSPNEKDNIWKHKGKKGLNFITIYNYFRDNDEKLGGYGSDCLAHSSDISTCPYCNEQYIYHFETKGTIKRVFDWDHFYPKDEYPFLAISFYNLVPSCKVCNFLKLNVSSDFYNPHIKINVDEVYRYVVVPNIDNNGQNIDISIIILFSNQTKILSLRNQFKKSFSAIYLRERMYQHKQVVKDILEKKKMYNEIVLNGYDKQLSSLGLNGFTEETKAVYWGIELDHKKYYLKPFSKLTNDLIREIL